MPPASPNRPRSPPLPGSLRRAPGPDKKTKRQERDAEIRKLDAEGMDKTKIARATGVNRRTVSRVLSAR